MELIDALSEVDGLIDKLSDVGPNIVNKIMKVEMSDDEILSLMENKNKNGLLFPLYVTINGYIYKMNQLNEIDDISYSSFKICFGTTCLPGNVISNSRIQYGTLYMYLDNIRHVHMNINDYDILKCITFETSWFHCKNILELNDFSDIKDFQFMKEIKEYSSMLYDYIEKFVKQRKQEKIQQVMLEYDIEE